jgi:uncharacterized membrane protein YgcG
MLTPRVFASAIVLASALVLAPLRSANACSGAACVGGYYIPQNATVPASLPGILFNPRLDEASTGDNATVALFRVENGSQVPVDITTKMVGADILVTPTAPLLPDTDYALEGSDFCPAGLVKGGFHTGAALPFPTSLGTLAASAQKVDALTVWTTSGSCTTSVTAAQIDVEITLGSEAVPWGAALTLDTMVDGVRFAHSVLQGGATSKKDTLFMTCSSSDPGANKGLAEGPHTVLVQASLPGVATVVKTDPITITLACPPPAAGTGGGGGGTGGGGSGGSDGGSQMIGGCDVGGTGDGGAWALAGIAAAIAIAKRRWRRG